MKIILIIVLCLLIVGCQSNETNNKSLTEFPTIATPLPTVDSDKIPFGNIISVIESDADFTSLDHINVDIDLVSLSDTMAYAMLSKVMYETDNYLNQSLKIKGIYHHEIAPNSDIEFNGILYIDSTNCCIGYLEIILPDDVDLPAVNSEILLIGEITSVEIGGAKMAALKVTDYIF